ncbi:MAG TPA: GNAT family N-acetyltransferase [Pseudonocardiaceae bacterium]|jgi:GNAT superfamily N-acetyltransferase|nr:GNAT family N-acetyltransferase [Pseudonocardiaceae bacterium]
MTDVRPWAPVELPALIAISAAATELFPAHGIHLPPDDPAELLHAARAVLVAGTPPIGFAALDELDGRAHLAEISVAPAHGRRGTGTALLTAACDWARDTGCPAITLTTFRAVPFNAPWYTANGFTELPESRWGPELRAVWAAESAAGLGVAERIAMIRRLR